ncbi:MAG: hypothetical protein R3C68_19185 [Myxococcota bacterium]
MSQATFARTLGTSRSSSKSLGRDVLTGTLAGQVAGLNMAAVMMLVFALFLGSPRCIPFRLLAHLSLGTLL